MAYHPFRHLGLKFVALVLASLLWLTVAGEHVVERILRAPVEFRNIPEHLEVVGDPPDSVEVRLRGSSALLSRLQPGDVVAMVDLQQARPGSRLFPISHEEVRVPYGVDVAQVLPGTLGIELEKRAFRTVPVVAQLDGEPAPGFVVGARTAEPAMVEISGPESRVKKIANATTEPVSVAGARVNVRDVVAVGLIDASLRLTKPQNVTVIVDILPAPVERELKGVLVRARNLGSGLAAPAVRPGSVTLLVRGRRDALAGVEADTVEAFVDLAGLGAGQYNLRVQVDPSQHFGVVETTPSGVDVTIKAIK
jgi:YbbR domain-containing protein